MCTDLCICLRRSVGLACAGEHSQFPRSPRVAAAADPGDLNYNFTAAKPWRHGKQSFSDYIGDLMSCPSTASFGDLENSHTAAKPTDLESSFPASNLET